MTKQLELEWDRFGCGIRLEEEGQGPTSLLCGTVPRLCGTVPLECGTGGTVGPLQCGAGRVAWAATQGASMLLERERRLCFFSFLVYLPGIALMPSPW